jgi:EAL domain-containing protein (putative c-di-GMP-specific phosphodiesterase class I)
MIDLGRSLGLRVVAEGVETHAARGQLESLGCAYAQGFLFARPASADETAELLRSALTGPRARRPAPDGRTPLAVLPT